MMIISIRKRAKARSLARAHNWAEAIKVYNTIGPRAQLDTKTLVQLGHAYKENGQAAEAMHSYHEAAGRVPFLLDAQLQAGFFHRSRSEVQSAVTFFARALVLNGNTTDLLKILEELGQKTEDDRDAIILTATLLPISNDISPYIPDLTIRARLYRTKARQAGRRHEWASAEQYYISALAVCPDNPALLMQLGHCQIEQGKVADALISYRRAALASPGDFEKYYHAGNALRLLGRRQSALAAYQASAKLNEDFSPSLEEIKRLQAILFSQQPSLNNHLQSELKVIPKTDRYLNEEPWLSNSQKTIFKYFSGSLACKE